MHERGLLKAFAFPIKAFMRSALKLDRADLRDERKVTIDDVLKRVDAAVGPDGKGYIVGDQLTYIDITFASLLAPLLVSRFLFKDHGRTSKFYFLGSLVTLWCCSFLRTGTSADLKEVTIQERMPSTNGIG